MKTILVLALWSAVGLASEEKDSFLNPQVAVPLVANSKYNPALAVVAYPYVYYTSFEPREKCIGSGLYRFRFGEADEASSAGSAKEEPLAEISCVMRLHVVSNQVLVVYAASNGGLAESLWDGQQLITSDVPLVAVGAERNWLIDRTAAQYGEGWNDPKQTILEGVAVSPSEWIFEFLRGPLPTQKDNSEYRLVLSAPPRSTKVRAKRTWLKLDASQPLIPNIPSVAFDNKGTTYLLTRGTDTSAMAKLVVNHPGKTADVLGGEFPYSDASRVWTMLKKKGNDSFGLRNPTAVLSMSEGVLIHDKTDYEGEWDSVIYVPREGENVYRVPFLPEHLIGIAGISVGAGGIVISQPQYKRVIYYSKKNPFKVTYFPPRDFQLNRELTTESGTSTQGARK